MQQRIRAVVEDRRLLVTLAAVRPAEGESEPDPAPLPLTAPPGPA